MCNEPLSQGTVVKGGSMVREKEESKLHEIKQSNWLDGSNFWENPGIRKTRAQCLQVKMSDIWL